MTQAKEVRCLLGGQDQRTQLESAKVKKRLCLNLIMDAQSIKVYCINIYILFCQTIFVPIFMGFFSTGYSSMSFPLDMRF